MNENIITLMRHGVVENTDNKNALEDTLHLSSFGKKQIDSLAQTFYQKQFDAIIISDTIRTHECAEIVLKYLQKRLPVIVEPALNPWIADKYATFLSWEEYFENVCSFVEFYRENSSAVQLHQAPPRNWETYDELAERVFKGVETCKQYNSPLVISHSFILRLLLGNIVNPKDGFNFASLHKIPANLVYPKRFSF